MGVWPAQLRVAIERLPSAATTWDDDDPAVIWAGTGDPVASPPGPTDALYEPFDNFTAAPWTLNGTASIVAGRNGTAAQVAGATNAADYAIPAAAQSDTLTIGFAFRRTDSTINPRDVVSFRSDNNTTIHCKLTYDPNTSLLSVQRAGNTIASFTPVTFTPNTWYYVETRVKLGDTPTGTVTVRINGSVLIDATGLDTRNGGTKTVFDTVRLAPALSGNTGQWDDLYLSFGAAATFKGDVVVSSGTPPTIIGPPVEIVTPYVWDEPAIDGGFTDAICDLQALTLEVGEPDELGLFSSAQCTFSLANPDGEYTAWTPDGRNTYFAPGRLVCLFARHAGVDWWLARLRIDRWGENADGTVTVEASDGFGLLARERAPFASGFAGQLPLSRIQSICALARFPDGTRGDPGDVTLTVQQTDRPPLEEIQRVALSDGGIVFVDADGTLVYRNRVWTAGRADQTRTDVFTDNVCDVGANVVWELDLADDTDQLATDVTVTNVAGLTSNVSEPWNGIDYFYAHPDPDYWTTQAEGDALAAAILTRQGQPRLGITSFSLYLNDPRQDLWLEGLDRRIGDRVEFLHDFPSPGDVADTFDLFAIVTSIRHEITPQQWVATIGTSKTFDYRTVERWDRTAWVWDDPDDPSVWR